jgi:hypothetical protein
MLEHRFAAIPRRLAMLRLTWEGTSDRLLSLALRDDVTGTPPGAWRPRKAWRRHGATSLWHTTFSTANGLIDVA